MIDLLFIVFAIWYFDYRLDEIRRLIKELKINPNRYIPRKEPTGSDRIRTKEINSLIKK